MAQLSLEEMKDIQKPGMTKEEADMAYFEKRYQARVKYTLFPFGNATFTHFPMLKGECVVQ